MSKQHYRHNNTSGEQQAAAPVDETLVDASIGSTEDIPGSEDGVTSTNDVTTEAEIITNATAPVITEDIDSTASTVSDPVVVVEPEPEVIVSADPAFVVGATHTPAPDVQPTAQASIEGELKLSTMGTIAMHNIADYMENMKPGKQVFPADGSRHQVSLYRALLTILNGNADEFTIAYGAILKLFNDNADGVFRDTHVFRFTEQMPLGENDRKAFQRLLNLIKLTADPKSRGLALKQINMSATMEFGVNDQGRQNILNFYGV